MRLTTLRRIILCILIALGSNSVALHAENAASYRIVYWAGGQVWTMAPDGSDQHAITHNQWAKGPFIVSPDGKYIVYFAYTSQGAVPDLLVSDINGQHETVLIKAGGERIGDVDWSPDSQKLVFAAYPQRNFERSELFIINRDGSNRVKLTGDRLPDKQGEVNDTDLRWSPNGQSILFCSYSGDAATSLYAVSADGKTLVRLIGDLNSFVASPNPIWTWDGKSIVFLKYPDLYIMGADGSHVRQITHFNGIYASVYGVFYERYGVPSFVISPDNRQVLTTFGYGANGVDIMKIDLAPGGWEKRAVLHADHNRLMNALWSPDGQWIFFERDQSDGDTIYRMNVDGSNVMSLVRGSGAAIIKSTTN
jgi:Tol biopolymer transport system component